MRRNIGVPSARGVVDSFWDYVYGGAGGFVYDVATYYTGNSLIGGGIAAALAGSVVRGTRGQAIATIAGFRAANEANLGSFATRYLPQLNIFSGSGQAPAPTFRVV